jgi:abequosyltransferase
MTKIKLSICIATYNRADFIGETLNSIIPQMTDEVELLVVDGNSPDHTQIVVEQYAAKCPQLRYVRLPEKGGVDQDYCKTVELAKGEYCWLFTDDDLLKQDAITKVLKTINNSDYTLVVVNAEVWDFHLKRLLEESRLSFREDRIYDINTFDRVLVDAGVYMSFIGCVVIKKSFWENREQKTYFGTEFIHIGVIFQSPLPSSAYVMTDPLIMIRYGNAQWKPRDFEIWMLKWPRLIWSFTHLENKIKIPASQFEPWRRIRSLLISRSRGCYTYSHYQQFILNKDIATISKFISLFISCLPLPLATATLLTLLTLRGKISKLLIYDCMIALGFSK